MKWNVPDPDINNDVKRTLEDIVDVIKQINSHMRYVLEQLNKERK